MHTHIHIFKQIWIGWLGVTRTQILFPALLIALPLGFGQLFALISSQDRPQGSQDRPTPPTGAQRAAQVHPQRPQIPSQEVTRPPKTAHRALLDLLQYALLDLLPFWTFYNRPFWTFCCRPFWTICPFAPSTVGPFGSSTVGPFGPYTCRRPFQRRPFWTVCM